MNGINERIAHLVPLLSRNKNTFCKDLGYNYNSLIENIVGKRQSKPGYDFLHSLLTKFPQVNATWLLTGEGEVMTNSKKSNAVVAINNEDVTRAPLVSQFAHAGYLRGYSDPEFMDSQPVYFSIRKYNNGNYVAFDIRGDSMRDWTEMSICDGDIVLCRELPVESWGMGLHVPKVFIIIHKTEGITCKEVIRHNRETGEIFCHSWNKDPEYSDFTLNLQDVMQLFYLKEISRKSKY
jgi:hypothetical protein